MPGLSSSITLPYIGQENFTFETFADAPLQCISVLICRLNFHGGVSKGVWEGSSVRGSGHGEK